MTDRDALRDRLDAVEEELAGERSIGGFDISEVWGEEEPDPDADIVIRNQIVMGRERAERAGREILGPADAPGDAVRVAPEDPP